MRFSVWPNLMQPSDDVLAVAAHADRTGWDGVWVADHFMGDGGGFGPATSPTLESTAVLAALAVATERVRLGPLVLGATYRHPAVVAKWAATVDVLSGGRLVLGVGTGWQVNEHEQYGIDLPAVRDRVDRLDEACTVLTSLLRAERTTFEGRWFRLRDALCEPKPVQDRLPLLVGGKGDRKLGLVARHADEWNMWGMPELIAARSEGLDRHCDRAAVAGSWDRVVEVVGGWRDAGVDEVIVPDAPLGRGAARVELPDGLLDAFAPFRVAP